MNLRYQVQHGMINLNYQMDHVLYQIFKRLFLVDFKKNIIKRLIICQYLIVNILLTDYQSFYYGFF